MDKSVPAGAALLLDFISSFEAPHGYDTVYDNKMAQMPKPLTSMTFDAVVAQGPLRTTRFGSSACGKYQFMTDTLKGLKTELKLSGIETFSPDLQDRMGYHLLKRRGYQSFMAGTLNRSAFGLKIAQEWASFPVLVTCKGAKRQVVRGQSYYAGDGLNKALVKPEAVEKALDRTYAAGNGPAIQAIVASIPVPTTAPLSKVDTSVKEPVRVLAQATGSGVRNGLSALWSGIREALKKA